MPALGGSTDSGDDGGCGGAGLLAARSLFRVAFPNPLPNSCGRFVALHPANLARMTLGSGSKDTSLHSLAQLYCHSEGFQSPTNCRGCTPQLWAILPDSARICTKCFQQGDPGRTFFHERERLQRPHGTHGWSRSYTRIDPLHPDRFSSSSLLVPPHTATKACRL